MAATNKDGLAVGIVTPGSGWSKILDFSPGLRRGKLANHQETTKLDDSVALLTRRSSVTFL